jgi:sugar/nucleoside kinase (ribokinase family)
LSRCEGVPPPRIGLPDFDIVLVDPVAGEIEVESIPRYKAISKYIYIDPQGFLRKFDEGVTTLADNPWLRERLLGINAIKVDLEEGKALTGSEVPAEIASGIAKMGVKEVLVTAGAEGTYLKALGGLYFLRPPPIKAFDGVGAGDLLGAGYAAARTDRDPPSSLAYAVACATSRIDQPALGKIPEASDVAKLATELAARVETLEGLG